MKPISSPRPAGLDRCHRRAAAEADYLGDRSLGTVLYLALKMGRPLFLEGEAGVGKTESQRCFPQRWAASDPPAML